MDQDSKKNIREINATLKQNGSVIARLDTETHNETVDSPSEIDAVTSATLKNNIYFPPIPVMMPPVPKNKKE